MRAIKPILQFLLIVGLIHPSLGNTVETNFLITPGHCVGRVCINDTRKMVKEKIGIPSQKRKLPDAYEVEVWRSSKFKRPQHLFVVYYKGSVVDIHVTSDQFKTQDGISTLNKLSELREKYPHGEENEYSIFQTSHNRVDWIIRDQGITFTAAGDAQGRIVRIAVHRIGKEKTIGYSEASDWYWYPE